MAEEEESGSSSIGMAFGRGGGGGRETKKTRRWMRGFYLLELGLESEREREREELLLRCVGLLLIFRLPSLPGLGCFRGSPGKAGQQAATLLWLCSAVFSILFPLACLPTSQRKSIARSTVYRCILVPVRILSQRVVFFPAFKFSNDKNIQLSQIVLTANVPDFMDTCLNLKFSIKKTNYFS